MFHHIKKQGNIYMNYTFFQACQSGQTYHIKNPVKRS